MVTFKFLSTKRDFMDFDVYRDKRDHSQFHLHAAGSRCESCSDSPVETDVEMPSDVYAVLSGKLSERGYILMPHDGGNSEMISSWWQLVALLM